MAVHIYEPGTGYTLGTPKHIATQGIFPGHVPITVSTDGFIIPLYTETNIIFSGSATIAASVAAAPPNIVLSGDAPVVNVFKGVTRYDYVGSGNLYFDGDTALVITQTGVLEAVYKPTPGPIIFDGEAEIGFALSYVTDDPNGGIVFDGTAPVSIKWIPGGRGVLKRKPSRPASVVIYEPSIYKKDAPIGFSGGSADTEFVDGKTYSFITTLPKVEKPIDRSKSFIKSLPKPMTRTPLVYEYKAVDNIVAAFRGAADSEFYDHNNYLTEQDELLMEMLMEDATTPVVVVSYDKKINKIRKDDEAVLEKLLF